MSCWESIPGLHIRFTNTGSGPRAGPFFLGIDPGEESEEEERGGHKVQSTKGRRSLAAMMIDDVQNSWHGRNFYEIKCVELRAGDKMPLSRTIIEFLLIIF